MTEGSTSTQRYFDWIKKEYGDKPDVWFSCQCTRICVRMKHEFTELSLMSGDVFTENGSAYEHTWLQTEDGLSIIDPTERQFSSAIVEYHATLFDSTDTQGG